VKVLIISDQNFLGWLKQLQQQQIEYLEHQYSPLVQIQQWSNLNNGNQLFESFITVENYPINSELRGEKIKIVDVQSFSPTNYSFNLTVEFDPDLSMVIDYDCQKFTATDIYRVLTQLQNLIENVTNYAEQTLSEIIITTTNPEETEQLLNSFNADFD
jgi:non-ribosomal peptide synthetase component F